MIAYVHSIYENNNCIGTVEYKDGDLVYTGSVQWMRDLATSYMDKGVPKDKVPEVMAAHLNGCTWASDQLPTAWGYKND